MKKIFLAKIEDDVLGPVLSGKVRDMYLPPHAARDGGSYWLSLEHRIMARVTDPAFVAALDSQKWWNVLDGWARTGLLAAGILVFATAALIQYQQSDESTAVYEYVTATAAPEAFSSSVALATQREPSVQQDAVINYVLAR